MKKTIYTLLSIACVFLLIAAAIFLGIIIGDKSASSWMLPSAIGCIVLSSLFNIIRTRLK